MKDEARPPLAKAEHVQSRRTKKCAVIMPKLVDPTDEQVGWCPDHVGRRRQPCVPLNCRRRWEEFKAQGDLEVDIQSWFKKPTSISQLAPSDSQFWTGYTFGIFSCVLAVSFALLMGRIWP